MPGLAKALALKKNIFLINKETEKNLWPNLSQLVTFGVLDYSDLLLAECLLKKVENPSLYLAALICHLSLSARKGHLCVRFNDTQIEPSIKSSWTIPEEHLEKKTDLLNIIQIIEEEILSIDLFSFEELITTSEKDLTKPIFYINQRLYLQKYWSYETNFIESIKKIELATSVFSVDLTKCKQLLNEALISKKLLKKQAEAVLAGCNNNLMIITGGPGTGKTYTAGFLIRIFLLSISEAMRKKCKITLAAPTGKAALNLFQSLTRALSDLNVDIEIERKTLHSLLSLSRKNEGLSYVNSNFIIVDESSMIDASMMSKLFSSIKSGSKLILMGDKNQLPSIEAGALFSDLVYSKSKKKDLSVVELDLCLRADLQTIIAFSHSIKNGDIKSVMDTLNHPNETIVSHLFDKDMSIKAVQQKIISNVLKFYSKIDLEENLEVLIVKFNKYRVLTPLKKGPFGTDELNQLIFSILSEKNYLSSQWVIPIIITQNDYDLQLFNGETGILIKTNPLSNGIQKGDLAAFLGKEGLVTFPALLLRKFEYAYCMSIHKSQGSEFEEVEILLPQGSEKFGREILYTAVTRAKKRISLWYQKEMIPKILTNQTSRVSGITQRI